MFPARTRLAPITALTAGALLLGGPLLGGCGEAASAQGIGRADLVAELARQLSGSSDLTYTADYQLTGGRTATVTQAQDPVRTAYGYPGGMLLVSGEAVTLCADKTCTTTAPPPGDAALPPALLAGVQNTGMVTPPTALALLNAATLSPDLTVASRDTTIAGHHATCVELTGVDDPRARSFTACITNDGALGSFTATVDGKPIDMAMTTFTTRTAPDAFTTPPGTRTVDRR